MYTLITNYPELKSYLSTILKIVPEDKEKAIDLLVAQFLFDTRFTMYDIYSLLYREHIIHIKYSHGYYETTGKYIITEYLIKYYLHLTQCNLCNHLFNSHTPHDTVTLYSYYHQCDIDLTLCPHCTKIENAGQLLSDKVDYCSQLPVGKSYYTVMNQMSVKRW